MDKLTVDELRKGDTALASVLNDIYDGVYIVDKKRHILFWNKGAEHITGYSADEVQGKWCGDKRQRGGGKSVSTEERGERLILDSTLFVVSTPRQQLYRSILLFSGGECRMYDIGKSWHAIKRGHVRLRAGTA